MVKPIRDARRIVVALDFPDADGARACLQQLDPSLCRVKVGKELFTRCGPQLVDEIQALGFDVFLDLKFHDIPNTVAKAVAAAAELGVWMVNVHASGGAQMMKAARAAIDQSAHKPLLIAVTVLTSMDQSELLQLGVNATPAEQVLRLARIAAESGMDGVVCSAQEAAILREKIGADFVLVTPGIRPSGDSVDDQKRILTPVEAIASGSSYLVMGRPITKAVNPKTKLAGISAELSGAFPDLC
jgi:orotidine-5'-phosphate decarboxylase